MSYAPPPTCPVCGYQESYFGAPTPVRVKAAKIRMAAHKANSHPEEAQK